MRNPLTRLTALLFAALLAPGAARAQDSQYWNLQYGPVAELLGGAVVGSSRDLSATFYNPGALALAADPSLLASVESFEATRIRAITKRPPTELSNLAVKTSPSLFAVAAPREWTGDHTLAISSLTRQDADLRVDTWQDAPHDGGRGSEALFDQSLTENWFGLSWAHPVGPQLGLGVTTYVVYRGQRTRREVNAQVATPGGVGGAALSVEDFDYSNYRLLWKAGFSVQRPGYDLGIALTTASIDLLGHGKASYSRSVVSTSTPPGAAVELQSESDLASQYRSPWSVAVGGAFRRGRDTVHGTVEWFGALDPYEVVDSSPFPDNEAGNSLRDRLQQRANSVVNFGFGYQRKVSERFSMYGAFTTDFTYAEKGDSGSSSLSTWDIYHVTAGVSLDVRGTRLTLGAGYSFGSDTRPVSLLDVEAEGAPEIAPVPMDMSYTRARVMLGFDFGS
jgi:hypothetical protein